MYLEAYLKLILERLKLEKNDSLFVSLPSNERTLKDYIEYLANEIGVEDIYFHYKDKNNYYSKHKEYIEKDAKMLLFASEKIDEYEKEIVDNYEKSLITLIPTKKMNIKGYYQQWDFIYKLTKSDLENPIIENNKIDSYYKKTANRIKSLKLNEMYFKSFKDTNIVLKEPELNFKSNEFPRFGIDISGNFSGIISADTLSFNNNDELKDLRIEIKNNIITDYDCDIRIEDIEEFKVDHIYLTDNQILDRYFIYNNKLIDKYSKNHLSLKNDMNEIILPITSNDFNVEGYNGKYVKIYKKNKFSRR